MTTVQKVIKYFAIAFAIVLIITIISAILGAIYGIGLALGLRGDNISEEMIGTKFDTQNVTVLDIDTQYTDLKLKVGEYLLAETNNKNISCTQDNNTIKIKEKHTNIFAKSSGAELIVYIPEDIKLENIKIENGAGKIEIENIKTEKLDLDLGAGDTNITNLNVLSKTDIQTGAGNLEIYSGIINNLNLEMGAGNVDISSNITGKSNIEAGVGNLNLNINGSKEDYELDIEKGLGEIRIDGQKISGSTKYGTGNNRMKVEAGIGNININFK